MLLGEELIVDESLLRVAPVEVEGLVLAELDVLLGLEAAAESRELLLIDPEEPAVLLVLPLGAVCVLVLGPGVSFADCGRVFLPVSPMAPEPVVEVLVCA